jgi:hypothetical protein
MNVSRNQSPPFHRPSQLQGQSRLNKFRIMENRMTNTQGKSLAAFVGIIDAIMWYFGFQSLVIGSLAYLVVWSFYCVFVELDRKPNA